MRTKKEFPKYIKLIADKKRIDQIIKPVNVVIHGDFLIIQNEPLPDAPCFFVYTLDKLDYLYSFGKLGGGEEEFVSPIICESREKTLFSVFDQRKRDIKNYVISAEGASLSNRSFLDEPTKFPLQEASFVNDSILVYLTVDNHLVSYNINSEIIIDSVEFETGIEKLLGGEYNQSIDFFHFSNYNSKIVTGHNFIDNLSLNECYADGKFKNKSISIKSKVPHINSELYDNIYQYVFVNSTSDLIFAQYSGYMFRTLQPFPINLGKRHFDFLIEVYDWDLNPKALLEFDSNILRCEIDEERKRIITWNPLADLDHLLIYTYNDIYK